MPPYLKYRGTFFTLLKHLLTRDNTFALIRSCGKDVHKAEKSKEDTWEPWKFRSRNFASDNLSSLLNVFNLNVKNNKIVDLIDF